MLNEYENENGKKRSRVGTLLLVGALADGYVLYTSVFSSSSSVATQM